VETRFSARPDRPWGPPSLLYNGYWVCPGGKVRPGRAADHSPPSSTAVMEEYSYTSTHPLGHIGPVTGSLFYMYFSRGFCGASSSLCWFNNKEFLCITHTVEHKYISPSSLVGIQLHVSTLYVGHLQVVI